MRTTLAYTNTDITVTLRLSSTGLVKLGKTHSIHSFGEPIYSIGDGEAQFIVVKTRNGPFFC